MYDSHDESSPYSAVWETVNVDLNALQDIVSSHFRSQCNREEFLREGSYARIFLFTLEGGQKIIARVLLPIRESVKTESEVAAMCLVRGTVSGNAIVASRSPHFFQLERTNLPVPRVYLYCSTPDNVVGAEWILMEHMPGERMADCMESLNSEQLRQLGSDLANVMASLFSIKASQCGSILHNSMLSSYENLRYHALRYPLRGSRPHPHPSRAKAPTIIDGQFSVGPVNNIAFLDYPRQVPADRCGPFDSERKWMEAFAFLGDPGTREDTKVERWTYQKILEIFDAVRGFYGYHWERTEPISNFETFHFAHGDLSPANVLVDRESGKITGMIDWEMAGFRPPWLAAVAAGWFNDDPDRFIMSDFQDERENYVGEGPKEAVVRAHFRMELARLDRTLFRHHLHGVELRAIFYACGNDSTGNVQTYLCRYHDIEWPVHRRGKFPFDFWAWYIENLDLWEEAQKLKDGTPIVSRPAVDS